MTLIRVYGPHTTLGLELDMVHGPNIVAQLVLKAKIMAPYCPETLFWDIGPLF